MPKVAAVREATEKADRRGRCYDLGDKGLVAIDPGDVHVGFAYFVKENDSHPACAYTEELTPDECADRLAGMLARDELVAVAVEGFNLFADKALDQVGSEMETPQLIGVIKYIVRIHNEFADGLRGNLAGALHHVELWSEGPHIKKPIRAQLEARGIDRVGRVKSHTGDAEEQGWYHLYRRADG